MSNRRELIDGLRALTQIAKAQGELATAGVLLCLCGAMEAGAERRLLDVCSTFSLAEIERLTGVPDWTEATINV